MFDETGDRMRIDRRGFLKGSALFAAALGLAAAVPAAAQSQDPAPAPAPTEKKPDEAPKKEDAPKKPLLDKNGRVYRVCDMCGGNMYKDANIWTCEQCGFTYEE